MDKFKKELFYCEKVFSKTKLHFMNISGATRFGTPNINTQVYINFQQFFLIFLPFRCHFFEFELYLGADFI